MSRYKLPAGNEVRCCSLVIDVGERGGGYFNLQAVEMIFCIVLSVVVVKHNLPM